MTRHLPTLAELTTPEAIRASVATALGKPPHVGECLERAGERRQIRSVR